MPVMNRLQSELQRLYPPSGPGEARAMVLALAGPADWSALARVWRGVQAELQLPAPAIAVSGGDALALWFSLQAPVGAARAAEFLARLRAHYLADVPQGRVKLITPPLPVVPAQTAQGQWSAFVAADLAPIFAETPWLDVEPSTEGQADLLARLAPIKPTAFEAAMQQLKPVAEAAPVMVPAGSADVDPRQFLQRVLNDETAPLALRVEAAKALLPRG